MHIRSPKARHKSTTLDFLNLQTLIRTLKGTSRMMCLCYPHVGVECELPKDLLSKLITKPFFIKCVPNHFYNGTLHQWAVTK